jgi:hypothetical protein
MGVRSDHTTFTPLGGTSLDRHEATTGSDSSFRPPASPTSQVANSDTSASRVPGPGASKGYASEPDGVVDEGSRLTLAAGMGSPAALRPATTCSAVRTSSSYVKTRIPRPRASFRGAFGAADL